MTLPKQLSKSVVELGLEIYFPVAFLLTEQFCSVIVSLFVCVLLCFFPLSLYAHICCLSVSVEASICPWQHHSPSHPGNEPCSNLGFLSLLCYQNPTNHQQFLQASVKGTTLDGFEETFSFKSLSCQRKLELDSS